MDQRYNIDRFIARGDFEGLKAYLHRNVGFATPNHDRGTLAVIEDFKKRDDIEGLKVYLKHSVGLGTPNHDVGSLTVIEDFKKRGDFEGLKVYLKHSVGFATPNHDVGSRAIVEDFEKRGDIEGLKVYVEKHVGFATPIHEAGSLIIVKDFEQRGDMEGLRTYQSKHLASSKSSYEIATQILKNEPGVTFEDHQKHETLTDDKVNIATPIRNTGQGTATTGYSENNIDTGEEDFEAETNRLRDRVRVAMEVTSGCGSRGQICVNNAVGELNKHLAKRGIAPRKAQAVYDDGTGGVASGLGTLFSGN